MGKKNPEIIFPCKSYLPAIYKNTRNEGDKYPEQQKTEKQRNKNLWCDFFDRIGNKGLDHSEPTLKAFIKKNVKFKKFKKSIYYTNNKQAELATIAKELITEWHHS